MTSRSAPGRELMRGDLSGRRPRGRLPGRRRPKGNRALVVPGGLLLTSRVSPNDSASFDQDVVVIGAGAAGFFAATAAAEKKKRTLLIEKNAKPGVKILASGGSKCNVTSTLPIDRLGKWFGVRAERFLRHSLHTLPPDAVRQILAEEGVPTDAMPFEKVFPQSGRALDVLQAFSKRARHAGVQITTDEGVIGLVPRKTGGFDITTSKRKIRAEKVIVTTGGKSYPKSGTTGDGYGWLEKLGHTIHTPRPALVPLVVDLEWVRSLTGIDAENALVQARDARGKIIFERRRPVLFTHRGLSGPGPMDVSRYLNDDPAATLVIDWMPDVPLEALEAHLVDQRIGYAMILATLPGELPRRLALALMKHAGVPGDQSIAHLRKEERRRLVDALKRCVIPVVGDEGFDKAEVTAGGVALDEVDPRTMASRKVPGLHIAGEILDVDGPIGGFNFQAAFSTGHVAGLAAAAES